MSGQFIEILGLLDAFRQFPNYQLERRADIFFTYYLPEILKDKFKSDFACNDSDIEDRMRIIPEFPLLKEKQSGKKKRESDKVDYAFINKNTVYLIELKTTNSSIKKGQVDILTKLKREKVTWSSLIADVFFISVSSMVKKLNYRDKYSVLVSQLYKIISKLNEEEVIEACIKVMKDNDIKRWGKGINKKDWRKVVEGLVESHIISNLDIKIVYIVPKKGGTHYTNYLEEFDNENVPEKKDSITVINYDDVIKALQGDGKAKKCCKKEFSTGGTHTPRECEIKSVN